MDYVITVNKAGSPKSYRVLSWMYAATGQDTTRAEYYRLLRVYYEEEALVFVTMDGHQLHKFTVTEREKLHSDLLNIEAGEYAMECTAKTVRLVKRTDAPPLKAGWQKYIPDKERAVEGVTIGPIDKKDMWHALYPLYRIGVCIHERFIVGLATDFPDVRWHGYVGIDNPGWLFEATVPGGAMKALIMPMALHVDYAGVRARIDEDKRLLREKIKATGNIGKEGSDV